jgi:DNA helicase HerA-like ATPase
MSSSNNSIKNDKPLGFIVGESYPYRFSFIAYRPVSVGEYVVVTTNDSRRILGLVENSSIKSSILASVNNYLAAYEGKRIAEMNERDKSYQATVRILGYIDDLAKGIVTIPSTPPEPGSTVLEASIDDLKVFSVNDYRWASIGTLLRNSKVKVYVNIDKIASRHLAILSVTGGGKSNLLALIAKRVAERNGTMVIFDYHGEYNDLSISNVNHIKARINPRFIHDADELADLLEVKENASVQRDIISKALTDDVRHAEDFWSALRASIDNIKGIEEGKQSSKRNPQIIRACGRLQSIIDSAVRRLGSLFDTSSNEPLNLLRPNMINILDMIEFSEKQADVAISYYLEEILEDRKRAERAKRLDGRQDSSERERVRFTSPVICAIEEAHVFLPSKVDVYTDTKYIASKIAREGRKFGVSLIIVSQRPRRLDPDVLSQMGSLAILRLTNPEDQRYINESSEIVSRELLEYLPSLNVGEAILVGQWVNIPSIVKIEKVEEKRAGEDISAVDEWRDRYRYDSIAREDTKELIGD